jgi:hypothetical protein
VAQVIQTPDLLDLMVPPLNRLGITRPSRIRDVPGSIPGPAYLFSSYKTLALITSSHLISIRDEFEKRLSIKTYEVRGSNWLSNGICRRTLVTGPTAHVIPAQPRACDLALLQPSFLFLSVVQRWSHQAFCDIIHEIIIARFGAIKVKKHKTGKC